VAIQVTLNALEAVQVFWFEVRSCVSLAERDKRFDVLDRVELGQFTRRRIEDSVLLDFFVVQFDVVASIGEQLAGQAPGIMLFSSLSRRGPKRVSPNVRHTTSLWLAAANISPVGVLVAT
jgi:hypothetical protein